METELLEHLMQRVMNRPLTRRIVAGVEVKTARGYGVVVDVVYRGERCEIIVELDGGARAPFLENDLQMVGHA